MASAEISSANGSVDRFHGGGGEAIPQCNPHGRAPRDHGTIDRMVVSGLDLDPQLGALLGESTTEIDVPRKNRVFCNRNLRMDSIEMIGFDMDYTLGLYHQDRLERLS